VKFELIALSGSKVSDPTELSKPLLLLKAKKDKINTISELSPQIKIILF